MRVRSTLLILCAVTIAAACAQSPAPTGQQATSVSEPRIALDGYDPISYFDPGHPEKGGIVHQQLPVRAQDVNQADIAGRERTALLAGQLIPIEESWQIGAMLFLSSRVAIDVVQEFLQLIETHGIFRSPRAANQAPQRGI